MQYLKNVAFWIWDYKDDFNSNDIDNPDCKSYEELHIVIMCEIHLLWLYILEWFLLLVNIKKLPSIFIFKNKFISQSTVASMCE